MTERGSERSDANATYVFAVCWNPDPSAFHRLSGVTGEFPVRTLPLAKLTAIVQTVRAHDFTDEAWQARLADRQELERYARAHHDVVTAAAASCPTVPVPMATVYHGEQRVSEALGKESERFHVALERIAHHAEWGVKVYAPPPPRTTRRALPNRARGFVRHQEPASPTSTASAVRRSVANGVSTKRCKRPRRWMPRSGSSPRRLGGCVPTSRNSPENDEARSSTQRTWSLITASKNSLS